MRFLNEPIGKVLRAALGAVGQPTTHDAFPDSKRVWLDAPPGTALELLNAVVRAHGGLSGRSRRPIQIRPLPCRCGRACCFNGRSTEWDAFGRQPVACSPEPVALFKPGPPSTSEGVRD